MQGTIGNLPVWLWWFSIFAAPVTGLLGGFGGIFLGHWLGRHKGIAERTWDQKRVAYSQINSALSSANSTLKLMNEYFADDPQRYFAEELYHKHAERAAEAVSDAERAFTANSLLFPVEYMEAFSEFRHDMVEDPNMDPPERYIVFQKVVSESLSRTWRIARDELLLRR